MGMIKIPDQVVEKFSSNISEIFSTGNLAEGKWNLKLSDFFKNYTQAKYAIPFSSNGSGLLAILLLLKRYRSYDKIFIQSNTMYGVKTIAITSGLNFIGSVPCSLPSLMPTLSQVSYFISQLDDPKRTVFLLSHIGGITNPDIEMIATLCKNVGIALVEDCAHSLGATLNNQHTGLFGVAGVYSLYATKAIAAGEGGIAITNHDDIGDQLSRFNIYDRFDQQQDVGVNFRISEIQALFSLCMSELSEEIILNKSLIANKYILACKKSNILYVDPYQNGQRGNHYKFTLIANTNAEIEFAAIKNKTSPVYSYALGIDPMSITMRHLCLPIWYALESEVVDQTIEQLISISN
jgi:dTDP-4-amino-4,6-dideoxygalactose transaminase